jgi:hypothetical protein
MEQSDLERRMIRCRYLITRGAIERLGIRDLSGIEKDKEVFIRECHSVYKKAQSVLTSSILEIESELERMSPEERGSPLLRKYLHWQRILESSYESFLWLRFGPSDVPDIYKGPKHGRLTAQNIESALSTMRRFNEDSSIFAVLLDFTRFSCIADLLLIPYKGRTAFIELKEGSVNETMLNAIKARNEAQWIEFFDKFGEKGIKQTERFFRQEQSFSEKSRRIEALPGTYATDKGALVVVESSVEPQYFTSAVDEICEKARQGKYAVDAIDDCLVVAALDTTSKEKYAIAEFDARLFVYNAYFASSDAEDRLPDDLVERLKKIEFTNWLDGLSSVFLIPLLLRPVSTRTFLDILFGRIRLLTYFHAPSFLRLCRESGLKAGFVREKWTNRLRSNQGWRKGDYPTFKGRALGYMSGTIPMVMGSVRLHNIEFNWQKPSSVAKEMAGTASQLKDISSDGAVAGNKRSGFTEQDLED